MLTALMPNWSGHILRTPRGQIKQALARTEASHTGVYILMGELDGQQTAYIGESEELGKRLGQHDSETKPWWDTAVLITSINNNLHKAHIKYLEARLVEIARQVSSVTLNNNNTPPRSRLSEADRMNMEGFIDTLFMALPAIRIDIFMDKPLKSRQVPPAVTLPRQIAPNDRIGTLFEMSIPKLGVKATALMLDGKTIVQAGSKAHTHWRADPTHSYANLFLSLLDSEVLTVKGEHATFSTDYAFNSPSAAAAIIRGRTANGKKDWVRHDTQETYETWIARKLTTSGKTP
ncbi:GIY-YIG nuclease family protein [Yoonia sp. MH D7]